MSRGGRGGKRVRPQVRAKGEDEDGLTRVVVQSSRQGIEAPERYPPLPNLPVPPSVVSASDRDYLDFAHYLHESLHYSGYYLKPKQKQSIHIHRYSDRYRRIQGKRQFTDEISIPSPHLFPPELFSQFTKELSSSLTHRGLRSSYKSYKSSNLSADQQQQQQQQPTLLYLSVQSLEAQMHRLLETHQSASFIDSKQRITNQQLSSTTNSQSGLIEEENPTKRLRPVTGDEDEEEEGQRKSESEADSEGEEKEELLDDDEDEMGGGDYTEKYQEDDDGEGDDAFGDDEGDII